MAGKRCGRCFSIYQRSGIAPVTLNGVAITTKQWIALNSNGEYLTLVCYEEIERASLNLIFS